MGKMRVFQCFCVFTHMDLYIQKKKIICGLAIGGLSIEMIICYILGQLMSFDILFLCIKSFLMDRVSVLHEYKINASEMKMRKIKYYLKDKQKTKWFSYIE